MISNDVEMEDAPKHKHDSGNNIEEPEGKVLDARIKNEGEEFPSAVTVAGTAMKIENGGDNEINKLSNEAKEETVLKSEMENQTNHETESDKPMYVDRSTGEQNSNKSEGEERSSPMNNAEELTAARSRADDLTDHKNGVIEQIATNSGLEEEKSIDNDMEAGNTVQNIVEENLSGDVPVENPKGSEKEEVDFVSKEIPKESDPSEHMKSQTEVSSNKVPEGPNVTLDKVPQSAAKDTGYPLNVNEDKSVDDEPKQKCVESLLVNPVTDGETKTVADAIKHESEDSCLPTVHEAVTPNSLVIYSSANVGDHSAETTKAAFTRSALPPVIYFI